MGIHHMGVWCSYKGVMVCDGYTTPSIWIYGGHMRSSGPKRYITQTILVYGGRIKGPIILCFTDCTNVSQSGN